MGLVSQRRGSIRVAGEDVSAFPAHQVARGFAAIAPEGRRLFLDQTVEDNLLLGGLHLRRDRARLQALLKSVYDLFPVLYEHRKRLSSYLSGGEQQMVAIGRMLMSDPKVIMLDEPMAGVNPALTQSLLGHIQSLRDDGTTVLFVEHDMHVVRHISDWVAVMAEGRLVAEGPADTVMSDTAVIDAYLGAHHDTDLGDDALLSDQAMVEIQQEVAAEEAEREEEA